MTYPTTSMTVPKPTKIVNASHLQQSASHFACYLQNCDMSCASQIINIKAGLHHDAVLVLPQSIKTMPTVTHASMFSPL